MYKKIVISVCVLVGVADAAQAQDQLIATAKRASVASLDSSLTAVPFERWLKSIRPAATIEWEVNDCGEGGDGNEAPTCVEAIIHLNGDSTARASLIVAGLDGKESAPEVWDLSIGAGNSFVGFKTLREWAAAIRGQRR